MVQQPEIEQGRERSTVYKKITRQIVPYSSLDMSKVLKDLLKKKRLQVLSGKGNTATPDINDLLSEYMQDTETKNIEHVEHFKQISQHED